MVIVENKTISIKIKFKLSLWSCIKIRIAGFTKCDIKTVGKLWNIKLRK